MKGTCIDRIKHNRITKFYIIELEDSSKLKLTANELKELIISNELDIDNLKIDTRGRLTDSGENIDGKQFNNWCVIRRIDGHNALCKCLSCNGEYEVVISKLKSGKSKQCKICSLKNKEDNLVGQMFGMWKVIERHGAGTWLCECQCENKTRRVITGYSLKNGGTKSCGHDTSSFKDLTNQQFGLWKVLRYIGDGNWECECQCKDKTKRILYGGSLRSGRTQSCGCDKEKNRLETLQTKYGERSTHRINNPREAWQIDTIKCKESFENYLNTKKDKPTINELSTELNVTYSVIEKLIHKYSLENKVSIWDFTSELEKELIQYIESIYDGKIIKNCRDAINPQELDIYMPDLKLAIEFNGNYWHSSHQKNKDYHQNKTIICAKKGIRLIHIFEYEWKNNRHKIERLLKQVICNNITRLGARETIIKEITYTDANDFMEKYHLQGGCKSNINIGMFYEKTDELVGVMTFGKPRFNNNYQYELIRLCFKDDIKIIGGLEKMFKYFVSNYEVHSVITYCDISKFTGNSYSKIGFKPIQPKPITKPNYIWYEPSSKKVLSRYETQKHKLIELGLGYENDTEDIIMERLGYYKIYDSGNIRMHYINY